VEAAPLPGTQLYSPSPGRWLAAPGDLRAALNVLGGPQAIDAKAWSWKLPPPRSTDLKRFRVGYVFDDALAPLAPDVKQVLEVFLQKLERLGVTLKAGWPTSFRPAELLNTYLFHLYAFLFSVSTPEQQEVQRRQLAGSRGPQAEGPLSSFADWQRQNFRRLGFRAQWQEYFKEVDVFLTPVAFSAAFPHDHSEPQPQRKIPTANGPRQYMDMLNWIAVATLTGCPSTVAPAGRTEAGLPVGVQIMGPYWEDDTPITFAELLERQVGGFSAPPGFAA